MLPSLGARLHKLHFSTRHLTLRRTRYVPSDVSPDTPGVADGRGVHYDVPPLMLTERKRATHPVVNDNINGSRIPMRYTQSQVRDLLDLPVQTYRYWARTVPHLRSRAGKGSPFTTGDILGLALTKCLCNSLGVAVGNVAMGLDAMFQALDAGPWPMGRDCHLVLSSTSAAFVAPVSPEACALQGEVMLMVACEPIMRGLRSRLLPPEPDALSLQPELLLCGGAVTGGRTTPAARLLPDRTRSKV